jgi:iron uptake system EfeUOB component EfeO/EfeM
MKKTPLAVSALAVLTALSLTACGGAKTTTETKPTAAAAKPAEEAKKGTIKETLPLMKKEVVELRKALKENDAAKTKTAANEVHELWEKFEDEVKAKDATLYNQIEAPLGAITAGAKAEKLDATALKKAVGELDTLLYKLDPALGAEGIKAGAAEMTTAIKALKDALAKGDAKVAEEQINKADAAWYVFEHDVKAKNADLYEKLEEPLKAIQAGVKQSPLDAKTLTTLADQLQGFVDQLTK